MEFLKTGDNPLKYEIVFSFCCYITGDPSAVLAKIAASFGLIKQETAIEDYSKTIYKGLDKKLVGAATVDKYDAKWGDLILCLMDNGNFIISQAIYSDRISADDPSIVKEIGNIIYRIESGKLTTYAQKFIVELIKNMPDDEKLAVLLPDRQNGVFTYSNKDADKFEMNKEYIEHSAFVFTDIAYPSIVNRNLDDTVVELESGNVDATDKEPSLSDVLRKFACGFSARHEKPIDAPILEFRNG